MDMTKAPIDLTSLHSEFDAVVMLTWSNWHKNPRSNRYHYATRFARELPVIFVQPDLDEETFKIEKVVDHNITILYVSRIYNAKQTSILMEAISLLGSKRPLLWIYNVFFENYVRRAFSPMRIYHATEDYLGPTDSFAVSGDGVREPLKRVLQHTDLLVSVSAGVAQSYGKYGAYGGASVVLRNGCDFDFWEASAAADYRPPQSNAKVVLFQGGINIRLDFDLLLSLTEMMPDWEFWFCGHRFDVPPDWEHLKKRPNVRDFGFVTPEEIAALSRQALVAIIPFKQDVVLRRSLPLKAYEYVACGLPVVTTPIDELAAEKHLFQFATTASEFAAAIEAASSTRTDVNRLEERRKGASLRSYDHRFLELKEAIPAALSARRERRPNGSVLILYDDQSTHVRTIEEHLQAFKVYSRHSMYYLPATGFVAGIDNSDDDFDFSVFDAVIVHYSVRLSVQSHLSNRIAKILAAYQGPKLLFIQDEYDATETARQWIERLGIDAVFTTVPMTSVEAVYPQGRFPGVDFIPTLTGYVPEDRSIDGFARPLEERTTLIGYRGRRLPHHYGDLGQEKLNIGLHAKRLAETRNLPVDIEVEDSQRIYGDDWYRFLGSSRATLGTESGSDIFDFDGSLAKASAQHMDLPYEEFRARHLVGHEGKVQMNQISPKVFEAIRLRTALVLFEGEYSGVVKPDRHFIPLRKDFSNFDDVVAKLQDNDYLRELTERAYREVIESGQYSYASFVREVDVYLDQRFGGYTKGRLLSSPALGDFANSGQIDNQGGAQAAHLLISDSVLRERLTPASYRRLSLNLMRLKDRHGMSSLAYIEPTFGDIMWLIARWLWLFLPRRVRVIASGRVKKAFLGLRKSAADGLVARLMPLGLKSRIRRYFR